MVFFFCCGPGWCFFFCSGPVPAPNGASPSPAFPRGRSKKKNTLGGVFFLLWPRAGTQRGFSFACLSPGPQQRGFSFACLSPGPQKKTPWVVCFFLLWPRAGAQRGFSFPCLSPGPQQKKKHPGWCFFFCCGPARTLTHSLRAWVAMPPPRRGGVFFFCCGPARTGGVFFFLLWPRPDAHSLTVGWGDFGKARVVFFFLLRPRRVFLDNNKKCLGYYIGSKKTRRGHSKKKNTTSVRP